MFSERWLNISPLRLTLRSRLHIFPRRIDDELWYFVSDPFTNEHARLTSEAWRFLARLVPGRTVGEAWEDAYRAGEDTTITQSNVVGLITALYDRNLLTLTSSGDSERLVERGRRRQAKPLLARMQSLLFLPVPLVDPDRALQRFAPVVRLVFGPVGAVVWLAVVYEGLSTLVERWGQISDASSAVFASPNPLSLFAAFLASKLLHELGHAGMCRRFGGAVHTLGMMLLVFAPLPYVDVSAAWTFPSRIRRIAVGAAGMIMDVFVGAAATLVWADTPAGAINDAALSLMLTATVATVLFNANPLMRFDGYYILCDLIEKPNLATHASAALRIWCQRLLGLTPPAHAEQPEKPHLGLVSFGAAALAYRTFAVVGIMFFLADQYYGAGLLISAILAVGAFSGPLLKIAQFRPWHRSHSDRRGSRMWLIGCGAALTVMGLALLPVPDWISVPAGIEAHDATQVTTKIDGRLVTILAPRNKMQKAGTPLLQLADPELALELQGLRIQMDRTTIMERRSLTEGGADLEPIRQRQRALMALIQQTETDIAALVVRAPRDGVWVAPNVAGRMNGWIERGTELGQMLPSDGFRLVAMVSQANSARLARQAIDEAELRCAGNAGDVLQVIQLQLVPHAIDRLPNAALGSSGGGMIAVSGRDPSGSISMEPVFRLDGQIIDRTAPWLYHGRSCTAHIALPPRPLLSGWIEHAKQFLQRRYQL